MKLPVPTALGIKASLFYGALCLGFFAAPYANLFFLLIVFLTVLGSLGAFWTVRNLSGVAAEAAEIPPIVAEGGGEMRAHVSVGRRRRFGLCVEIRPQGCEPITAWGTDLRGAGTVTGIVPPLPRGVYPIRRARVFSTWPLGLFRARKPIVGPEELVVYPAPAETGGPDSPAGGPGDLHDLLAAGAGMLQPSELREYRPGDELRRVHWKASARRGTLVVTEFEGGGGAGSEAVLDRRCEPEALEEALSILSALALAAKERKELTTLHSQGFSATFGTGHRPFGELLRFLAAVEPMAADGPPPPPVSPSVLRLPRPEAVR